MSTTSIMDMKITFLEFASVIVPIGYDGSPKKLANFFASLNRLDQMTIEEHRPIAVLFIKSRLMNSRRVSFNSF